MNSGSGIRNYLVQRFFGTRKMLIKSLFNQAVRRDREAVNSQQTDTIPNTGNAFQEVVKWLVKNLSFSFMTMFFRESLFMLASREPRYLRPTLGCLAIKNDVHKAMAEIGKAKTDQEFLKNAFDYVKNRIQYSPLVTDGKGMYERLGKLTESGYSGCGSKSLLLISLARERGIKSRYCVAFSTKYNQDREETKTWGHIFPTHIFCEFLIGERWVQADCSLDDALEVGFGLPITLFGLVVNLRLFGDEEEVFRLEGLPLLYFVGFKDAAVFHERNGTVRKVEAVRNRGAMLLNMVGKDQYLSKHSKFYSPSVKLMPEKNSG